VTAARYVPDAGDVVWMSFSPQAGREQAGHRPAVVITPRAYNAASGLMLCCPVTTKSKDYPFEVALAGDPPSVALTDHARSADWRARKAVLKGKVVSEELLSIKAKLRALIG
jgi:mRNA interferase MazF